MRDGLPRFAGWGAISEDFFPAPRAMDAILKEACAATREGALLKGFVPQRRDGRDGAERGGMRGTGRGLSA